MKTVIKNSAQSSRPYPAVKIQNRNSKTQNHEKTPFFKAIQRLSKTKISIMHPTQSEYIRLNPSNFLSRHLKLQPPEGSCMFLKLSERYFSMRPFATGKERPTQSRRVQASPGKSSHPLPAKLPWRCLRGEKPGSFTTLLHFFCPVLTTPFSPSTRLET